MACEHRFIASREAFMTGDPKHPAICTLCGGQREIRRSEQPNIDQNGWIATLERFGHGATGLLTEARIREIQNKTQSNKDTPS